MSADPFPVVVLRGKRQGETLWLPYYKKEYFLYDRRESECTYSLWTTPHAHTAIRVSGIPHTDLVLLEEYETGSLPVVFKKES